jgi:hypothetical protein
MHYHRNSGSSSTRSVRDPNASAAGSNPTVSALHQYFAEVLWTRVRDIIYKARHEVGDQEAALALWQATKRPGGRLVIGLVEPLQLSCRS